MSEERGTPAGWSEATDHIRVGVIEQQREILRQVLTLAAQSSHLDVHALKVKDATAVGETYGAAGRPEVLLVGLDTEPQAALAAAKQVVTAAPGCGVIVYGRAVTAELLAQALAVGARQHLPYPCDAATLCATVVDVYAKLQKARVAARVHDRAQTGARPRARAARVLTVFSPKGGVGTSTLVVNLACALRTRGHHVAIVDGNISFGTVNMFLNLPPHKSMMHLLDDPNGIQDASLEEALVPHASGLRVLLAPPHPEDAERISADHLRTIIGLLRPRYDYVLVDTWPSYDDRVLALLEEADQILVPTGPELPAVTNLASFLRVARLLGFPQDKVIPILMRANSVAPGHLRQLERFLQQPLAWRIVSDGPRVTQSVNEGQPFVLTEPSAAVSQNIYALARKVEGPVATDHPDRSPWHANPSVARLAGPLLSHLRRRSATIAHRREVARNAHR